MFKDKNGLSWSTDFAFDTFERESHLIDLTDVEQVCLFIADPMALMGFVYRLSAPEDISFSHFLSNMNGDTLEEMRESFWESWVNFSPSKMKPALAKLKTAMEAEQARAIAEAEGIINGLPTGIVLQES